MKSNTSMCGWCIPKRYIIVFLAFLGYMNMYCLRTNLSMAIVQMTEIRNITFQNGTVVRIKVDVGEVVLFIFERYWDLPEQWPASIGQQSPSGGILVELHVEVIKFRLTMKSEFDWNSEEKGFILSAFSYGYLLAPFGGMMAVKLGGGTVFGIGVLVTGITTLFTQLLLNFNFYLFIVSRIIEGAFEAFSFASISELWSRWAIPDERSKFVSFSFSGVFIGTALSFSISGFIIKTWDWPAIFYTNGIVALLWYLFWVSLVANDPVNDKFISEKERSYIIGKINRPMKMKIVYPWKDILTSGPLWAACFGKFVFSCGHTITIMCLPQFIKDVSSVNIKDIGFISSVPHICAIVSYPLCGYLADYIRSREILKLTQVHNLYICIGFMAGASVFIVAGLWSNFVASIVCLSVFKFFISFSELTLQVLVLDMAPQFAALLAGITNSFLTLAAIVSPTFVGFIVTEHSRAQWNICFISLSVLYIAGAILFVKNSSGNVQPWAISANVEANVISDRDTESSTNRSSKF